METVSEKSCKICEAVTKWLKQPFKEDGTVLDWFLFVLLIGIASWFWSRVLARIGV